MLFANPTSICIFLFFTLSQSAQNFFKACYFSQFIFTWNMWAWFSCLSTYPSAYLSVSMATDRRQGECPCPRSVLLCQICIAKSVKVINELCFRLLGMLSLMGRLSPSCHRVGLLSLMAETDKLHRPTSCHSMPSQHPLGPRLHRHASC